MDEPLWREDVDITRVPVQRVVDGPIPVCTEGDTTIISLVEEVLVVEKRLMLTEELHLRTRRRETRPPQRVTLRREEARVERLPHTAVTDDAQQKEQDHGENASRLV